MVEGHGGKKRSGCVDMELKPTGIHEESQWMYYFYILFSYYSTSLVVFLSYAPKTNPHPYAL